MTDSLHCIPALRRGPPQLAHFLDSSMAPSGTQTSATWMDAEGWPLHQSKSFVDPHAAPLLDNMHFESAAPSNHLDYVAASAASDGGFQIGIQPCMAPVPFSWDMQPVEQEPWHSISLTPYLYQFDHTLAPASHSLDRSISLSRSTACSSSVSSLSEMTSQLSDVSEFSSRYDSDQESPNHASLSPSRATSPIQTDAKDANAGLVIHNEAEFQLWCDMEFGPRSRSSTGDSVAASDTSSPSMPRALVESAFTGFATRSPPTLSGSLQALHLNAAMQPSMYTGQGVTPSALTALPLTPSLSMPSSSNLGLCISPLSASFPSIETASMASSPGLSPKEVGVSMALPQARTRSLHSRANSVLLAAGGRQFQTHSAGLSRSLTDQGQTTPRAYASPEYFATPAPRSHKMRSHSQGGDMRPNACLLDSVASDRQRSQSVQNSKSPGRRPNSTRSERGTDAQFVCGMMIPGQAEPCMKAYKRTEHLKRHQISHEMIKPYACPLCDRPFDRTDNLNQHIKTHQNKDGRNTKLLRARIEREREMAVAATKAAAAAGATPNHP